MKQVNIVVGRFQPFTLGHLKCCTKAFLKYDVPTVLCVIDTSKTDDRHPFLTKLLWSSFKGLVKKYDEIEDIILIKSADITKIVDVLTAKGYEPIYWTCGTDRVAQYRKMCEKYAPEITVLEIERDNEDVSATQVRNAIRTGNEQLFKQLTPEPIHKNYAKFYNILTK